MTRRILFLLLVVPVAIACGSLRSIHAAGTITPDTPCSEAATITFGAENVDRSECVSDYDAGCAKKGGKFIDGFFKDCASGVNQNWCCAYLKGKTCASIAATALGGAENVEEAKCMFTECGAGLQKMSESGDCATYLGMTGGICCAKVKGAPATVNQPTPGAEEPPKTLLDLDPLKGKVATDVIKSIISAFLGMVGALALLVFVWAGITWMTAASSDRVKTAKEMMKYAVIGIVLIAFSYAISFFFIKMFIGDGSTTQSGSTPEIATPPPINP